VVTGDTFQFGFSVLILSMIIMGGLGSIWGALVGGLLLGYVNYWLLPNVLNDVPGHLGLNFQLSTVEFGVYGFLLVLVMIVRPQGLLPERRRRLELTAEVAAEDAQLTEVSGSVGAST
jgi:branched-chain amino acid transport system permease protein